MSIKFEHLRIQYGSVLREMYIEIGFYENQHHLLIVDFRGDRYDYHADTIKELKRIWDEDIRHNILNLPDNTPSDDWTRELLRNHRSLYCSRHPETLPDGWIFRIPA